MNGMRFHWDCPSMTHTIFAVKALSKCKNPHFRLKIIRVRSFIILKLYWFFPVFHPNTLAKKHNLGLAQVRHGDNTHFSLFLPTVLIWLQELSGLPDKAQPGTSSRKSSRAGLCAAMVETLPGPSRQHFPGLWFLCTLLTGRSRTSTAARWRRAL